MVTRVTKDDWVKASARHCEPKMIRLEQLTVIVGGKARLLSWQKKTER